MTRPMNGWSLGPLRRGVALLRGLAGRARANLERAHRTEVPRSAGFALMVVIVTVSILGAVVGDFGYNARVDYEAAANARDQLRAEYLARSGINLSRLLIKVQQSVIDKLNATLRSDFQISDFAPYLMSAFGGGEDERKAMGDFLGLGATSDIKGLGMGKGASFDVSLGAEDGKINVNCGGGVPLLAGMPGPSVPGMRSPAQIGQAPGNVAAATMTPPQALYSMLMSVTFSPRYNRLFETPTPDGQYVNRDDVARAIIDWTDLDEARFEPASPSGSSSGSEDYRYDASRDPYRAHNNYFDTVEEVNLVRGVGDDFFGSFGSMFTVYGGCKVNLRAVTQENWPILAAVLRTAAVNPSDPVLLDDVTVSALAQQMGALAMMLPAQTNSIDQWAALLKNGGMPSTSTAGQSTSPLMTPFSNLPGLAINSQKLGQVAKTGPREIYRIESTGTVKRSGGRNIQVRVRAIFDTRHFNQNTTSPDVNDRMGTWVYWRME